MQAAAEPLPDDPDNRRDDEIEVTQIPDGFKEVSGFPVGCDGKEGLRF